MTDYEYKERKRRARAKRSGEEKLNLKKQSNFRTKKPAETFLWVPPERE